MVKVGPHSHWEIITKSQYVIDTSEGVLRLDGYRKEEQAISARFYQDPHAIEIIYNVEEGSLNLDNSNPLQEPVDTCRIFLHVLQSAKKKPGLTAMGKKNLQSLIRRLTEEIEKN